MANVTTAVTAGATIALRRRFSASGFLPDVRRYGATYFNYVGRALSYILAAPETPDDRDNRLRLGFGTEASALDRERFEARFGCKLIENYGSSEGVIAIVRLPGCPEQALGKPRPGDEADVGGHGPGHGQGVRRPRSSTSTVGSSTATRRSASSCAGTAGARFEGYYNNEEATAERVRDGWFWSGDLAYRDADGWFYFAGRSADRLRVDSENFAAAPIESILSRLPGRGDGRRVPGARRAHRRPGHGRARARAGRGVRCGRVRRVPRRRSRTSGRSGRPATCASSSDMPLTANNKVNKQPLRSARWETGDRVWVREREGRAVPAHDRRRRRGAACRVRGPRPGPRAGRDVGVTVASIVLAVVASGLPSRCSSSRTSSVTSRESRPQAASARPLGPGRRRPPRRPVLDRLPDHRRGALVPPPARGLRAGSRG